MPSELNLRAVFAAAAAFLVALAVAYALSSTGQASEGSGTPGAPAEALDVASGVAGQSTLGEAEALPALVKRPKPPPPKPKTVDEPADEPATPAAPVAPVTPTPTYTPPAPEPYTPPAPPPPAEPPVEFEDSG
jgi:outer membrane biosynthesis protein TonB